MNNQYVLEQQLQYRVNPNNRVRFFGAYRLKRYPLEDIGKNAVDPYFGIRFDQKLKRGAAGRFFIAMIRIARKTRRTATCAAPSARNFRRRCSERGKIC